MTKVLSQTGLTELIQLSKNEFLPKSGAVEATTVALATVATTGSYNDLSNKPTIPTVNNATLTIQKNGSNVATFTANASSNVTANISVPTVDQSYSATSANAQSGVAVASAIGNGSVTINQGGTPRGTFTMNQNSNLTIDLDGTSGVSAIAILNKNTASPYQTLGIWQGTEYQWEHDIKTWYNWQTIPTANIEFLTDSLIPTNQDQDILINRYEIIFTNGVFLTAAGAYPANDYDRDRYNQASYSTDNGQTWQSSVFRFTYSRTSEYGDKIAAGGGVVLFSMISRNNMPFVSTDNGLNFDNFIPIDKRLTFNPIACLKYCNDRFIAIGTTTNIAYDSSGEWNWQYSTMPISTTWNDVAYGNGIYVAVGNGAIAYSTDNCATWHSATPPRTANWESIVFGDGKFVLASKSGKGAYSINGTTWLDTTEDLNGLIKYGDNHFVVASSTTIKYSSDLNNWFNVTIPNNNYYPIIGMEYGNGHFIIMIRYQGGANKRCFDLTFSSDSCYTIEELPTTTSTVYSEPETVSSYTISSVTSGAITLSNNNTYYYNQSGNQYTYQTVGNSHPEYLCFIDGVGVKIGNTTIATNNSNNS